MSSDVSSLSPLSWERTGIYIVGEARVKGRRATRPLCVNTESELSNCYVVFRNMEVGGNWGCIEGRRETMFVGNRWEVVKVRGVS